MSAGDPTPESDRFGDSPHPRETVDLFGHAAAEAQLLTGYRSGRLPHAWILAGREGIGKATLAWRFARFLLSHPDPESAPARDAADLRVPHDSAVSGQIAAMSHSNVAVLRRAWNEKDKKHYTEIRVDDVRRASRLYQQASAADGYRICILDSADDLNRNAANALLKLIEEPPPRSLFLIIAHQPGRIIPTVRSRCRLLLLQPLSPDDVARAASAAHPDADPDAVRAAAGRAGGSVRVALRALDRTSNGVHERIHGMLGRLPAVDWREVHHLAEAVAPRAATESYEEVLTCVLDWLDDVVTAQARAGVRYLAPYPEVWEKLRAAARETDALNLDRRPLIVSLFADLAAATRAGRA